MKICYIHPGDLSITNGGRTHTIELVKNWVNFGHQVFLFSNGLENEEVENFHYIEVPQISLKGLYGISFFLSSIVLLFFYHIRFNFDIIYERKMLFTSSALPARILGIPLVIELNDIPISMDFSRIIHDERNPLKKFLLLVTSPIFYLDAILTTNFTKNFVATARLSWKSIDKKLITHIPFGSNIDLFKPMNKIRLREKYNYPRDSNIICFTGTFLPWQGIEYLIDAAPIILEEIPESVILLIGDEEPKMKESVKVKERVLDLIESLDLIGKVLLRGRVPYEEVPEHINASDICVVTQRPFRSGFTPLKIFEYMACGKPVVASNISGIKEIIKESGCGILVPPENPKELARAIIKLLKDDNLRKNIGEKGLKSVREKYNWENVAKEALQVCEKAIGKRKNENSEIF